MNSQVQAAKRLCSSLVQAGVQAVVLCPGSRNTPLILAFAALGETRGGDKPIRVINVLDERAAAFIALGLSKTSGPTVLCCTSGSAIGHTLPAVMEAAADGLPLIVLSADRPVELQQVGAPQTCTQAATLRPHVVEELLIAAPAHLPRGQLDNTGPTGDDGLEKSLRWIDRQGQRAVATTLMRGGPVHINMAFRKPLGGAEEGLSPEGHDDVSVPLVMVGHRRLTSAQLQTVRRLLYSETRGLIFCGHRAGISSPNANRLATRLGWPLVAEASSGVRGSIDHADLLCESDAFAAAYRPHLTLHFGRTPTTARLAAFIGSSQQRLMVDQDGRYLDPTCRAATLLATCPEILGEDLSLPPSQTTAPTPTTDWLEGWRAAAATATKVLRRACSAGATDGLSEGGIAYTLGETDDARLFVGSSMPIRDVNTFARHSRCTAVFANRGVNGIDGAIATACGVALGRGQAITAVIGDLTFFHDMGGLMASTALAAETNLALRVLVVHNDGGRIFEHLPFAQTQKDAPEWSALIERHFLTPQPHSVGALCGGLQIPHQRIESLAQLNAALQRPVGAGLEVIEAVVDPRTSAKQRRRLVDEVALALNESSSTRPVERA